MAYESVNIYKLDSALNKLDNINCDKINDLINSLQNGQWQSPSRNRIINALRIIANETYIIQNQLKKYKTAANYIEQYKELDGDLDNYKDKLSNYKKRLNKCEDDDSWSKNYLEGKVDTYESRISSNRAKMRLLNEKISNLVK